MEIKAIIFDYGGTLDTGGCHWSEVLWQAYQKEEIPVGKPDFRDAYVFAERRMEAEPLIHPDDTFLQVLRTKADLQTKYLMEKSLLTTDELTRRPDAEHIALDCYAVARRHTFESLDLLRHLSQRYSLALVSNFYGNLDAVLSDFGLDCFQLIVESAKVGIRKPDPELFRYAIRQLSQKLEEPLLPAEMLVVGDSLRNDILPAKSVGCRTAWLKGQGWDTLPDTAPEADYVIGSINELIKCLK